MTKSQLLLTALGNIEKNPMGWNQGRWCMCFAAHIAVAAGAEFVSESKVRTPDGREMFVGRYASEAAGLSDGMAELLFHADNDLPYLRRTVNALAACPSAKAEEPHAVLVAAQVMRQPVEALHAASLPAPRADREPALV